MARLILRLYNRNNLFDNHLFFHALAANKAIQADPEYSGPLNCGRYIVYVLNHNIDS